MTFRTLAITAALSLILPTLACASMILAITPLAPSTPPGVEASFNGSLTNSGPATVYLNGDISYFYDVPWAIDDGPLLQNAPLFLDPGESFSGLFFKVVVSPQALPGVYVGYFAVAGGESPFSFEPVAETEFQLKVANVAGTPEPRLLGPAAIAILLVLLRARRQTRPHTSIT